MQSELENVFKDSVVDYLDACKELGKKPEKAYKGSFNVRISEKLHYESSILAKKKGTNLNEVVKVALSYIVQHEELLNT